ncbi:MULTISPECIES: efflux RND transporter periplasmic adaptor subunit [Paraburkholderia]|uniref:HlyD family secretion protein n=1 Tax=Paraburkholderia TaxID=1822464 RepID=UPI002258840F|nr:MULTISPECIES: efflux RND transporter periplasmic adaptor subunit [Paraburkholderia]MCX4161027.1 efflux RND transporter periplasmic adaptor subunit [Paraburkholderia megapolitana]MDN7156523.1 efflux RND transporter periplasmic adaptor subunit [Paraburkholderia sp. CHISQ3]MDQ6493568.1 efflux RND transporter periplasmic adaptor subunit [Paraburkholderia megapolitana]
MTQPDTPAAAANAGDGKPAAPVTPAATSNPAMEPASQAARRRRYFRWFGAVLVLFALASGAFSWLTGRGTESTDDAYVAGDVVQVSSQIPGTAVAVIAQNTDWVDAGAPLVELDQADARLSLDSAVEQLAHAVREYRAAHADAERENAQTRLRETDAARAADDLQRRLSLARDGGVALEDIRHARDSVSAAAASLDAQRAAYMSSAARTDGTTIDSNPLVRAAAAQVRSAALALHRTEIRAPLAGLVTRRVVQVGERVTPGGAVMAIVPLDRVWVEANFKESQLREMHAGQPVELQADLYGSSIVYHGRIEGFEAGTGAAFASVPAQNATGNWIKVVQRVPVRIALDPRELRAHPLRIGLSMNAAVSVGESSGSGGSSAHAGTAVAMPLVSAATAHPVDITEIFRGDENIGDKLVAQTIRANSPVPQAALGTRKPGA